MYGCDLQLVMVHSVNSDLLGLTSKSDFTLMFDYEFRRTRNFEFKMKHSMG